MPFYSISVSVLHAKMLDTNENDRELERDGKRERSNPIGFFCLCVYALRSFTLVACSHFDTENCLLIHWLFLFSFKTSVELK